MRTVGILVPTLEPGPGLERCLRPLVASGIGPVLVLDSSSTDGTPRRARDLGARVGSIERHAFNHGATREYGRRVLGTDVVVMVTQDAYVRGPGDLARLVAPVVEGRSALAYGRQVPRPGADLIERHARTFSYPPVPEVRTSADIARLGTRAFFCSNAFAAWDNGALDGIGGFPTTLTHEDAIACARLLRAGHRVEYVADAVAVHSHRLGAREEFMRYFQAGAARAQFAHDLRGPGGHRAQGGAYSRRLLEDALRRRTALPGVALHLAARLTGFAAGAYTHRMRAAVGAEQGLGRIRRARADRARVGGR